MKGFMGMLGVSLLLFSAAGALCQSGPDADAIDAEEYGIYQLVVEKLEGRCPVEKETLDGVRADAEPLMLSVKFQLDADIIQDFNRRNLKRYTLSEAFVDGMARGYEAGTKGRKKATLSRVGFNGERRRALLLVGITLYYPEDIMNEGTYVFLEKQNDRWAVVKTAGAWNMRMGPLR